MHRPLMLFVLAALILSACATPTPAPTATSTPEPTSTPTPEPTATLTPTATVTPRPSPTPNLAATQQYEDMAAKVKEYFEAQYISTDQGAFKHLDDYSDSWAQIGWYQWSPIGRSAPDDFIIRSEVTWQSASKSVQPSGCGYVFRLQENGDHYMIFISLDGYVYSAIVSSGNLQNMGQGYYGKGASDGSAKFTLIVEDDTYQVLVNDTLVKKFIGRQHDMLSGRLAYTIVSGINSGFGTRCTFTNTQLWTIKK